MKGQVRTKHKWIKINTISRMHKVSRLPWVSCCIIALMLFFAIFANLICRYDPTAGDLGERFMPPFWMVGGKTIHLLGTDGLGRDVLSRLIFGTRISLTVGFFSVGVAGILGTLAGILSGFFGRWVDQLIMRVVDTWLSMPPLIFAVFLAMVLGPGVINLIIVLGLTYWTRYARVIRSEVLSLKERDFVSLARIAGCSSRKIMMRHILPNVINSSVVVATLSLGMVIVAEASLSFLGLGVPPPHPAWGSMLSDALPELIGGRWWQTVFPGICIMLVVVSLSSFGDWLRVRLDPKLRQI